jgi:hypothetical protein
LIVLSKIGDELDFYFGPDSQFRYISEPETAASRQSPSAHDHPIHHVALRLTISRIYASPSPAHFNNGNAHIWEHYGAQAAHDRV